MKGVVRVEGRSMSETKEASIRFFPKNSVGDKIVRIILWEDDMVNSAIALSCGLLFVFLVEHAEYTVFSLISYLALLQLVVCFTYVNGMRVWIKYAQGSTTPTQTNESYDKEYMTVDSVRDNLHSLIQTLNPLIALTINIFRCKDNVATIKAAVLFYLLALLGSMFDEMTLFGIGYLALFTLPKVYILNKDVADKYLSQINGHIGQLTSSLVAKTDNSGKEKKN